MTMYLARIMDFIADPLFQKDMSSLGPCVLEGEHVYLQPLKFVHTEALLAAAQDSDWSWMSMDIREATVLKRWMGEALVRESAGLEYPFVVYSKDVERVVGSTRYMDIRQKQRGVEIGWTWYSSSVWGTVVNPECKYLLMQHAFEEWEAIRVQLKTDSNNAHSQAAILKLGAKFEGKLRNHRIRQDGSTGDSMMYSVTVEEWSGIIKESLRSRIESASVPTG